MVMTTQAQQRCCGTHSSLEQLTRHLIEDFRGLDALAVAREVARGMAAADFAGLAGHNDRLVTIELIARHQLELASGRRMDIARLDPERHSSRATAGTAGQL